MSSEALNFCKHEVMLKSSQANKKEYRRRFMNFGHSFTSWEVGRDDKFSANFYAYYALQK